jgi:hypothetical protein
MDEEEEELDEVSIMKTSQNQDIRHLPNQYQIKVQGVCVVTGNLIKETLATYNGDAIDWVKLHIGGEGHLDERYRSRHFIVHSAGSRGAFVLLLKSETICENNSVRGVWRIEKLWLRVHFRGE